MQHKNANKRRKMAVEVIAISAAMVFALVSNINGHNMQIAIAATKNNNSPTTTTNSYSSNTNQMSPTPAASPGSTDKATKLVLALRDL